jgi:aminobenzoyl-glutamate utilization protein B
MTAIDLLTKPDILAAAKQYFAEQTKETKWQSLIPVDAKPPIHINREKMERFQPALDKLRYDPAKYKTYLEQLGVTYPTVRNP